MSIEQSHKKKDGRGTVLEQRACGCVSTGQLYVYFSFCATAGIHSNTISNSWSIGYPHIGLEFPTNGKSAKEIAAIFAIADILLIYC